MGNALGNRISGRDWSLGVCGSLIRTRVRARARARALAHSPSADPHRHTSRLLAWPRSARATHPRASCGVARRKVQVASPRVAEMVFNTPAPIAPLFIHPSDSPCPAHSHPTPTFPRSTIKINYFSLLINLRPAPSFKELKKKKNHCAPRERAERLISKQDLCGAGILKQLES